jgi:hypothetical protein
LGTNPLRDKKIVRQTIEKAAKPVGPVPAHFSSFINPLLF